MGVMQARRLAAVADDRVEPLLQPQRARGVVLGGDGRAQDGEADVSRDVLGRFVFRLLDAIFPGRLDDLQAPRVAGLVRQLRQRVIVVLCCTVLTLPIAMWLLLRGVATYIATEHQTCNGPLQIWLLGFLMLQLGWPICMPSVALLLFIWCLGAVLLLHEARHCQQVREFVVEASVLQTLQALMLLAAAVAALTAQPLVRRLGELLSHSGTDPEVVRHIAVLRADQVHAEEECVICLSREDEDGVPWRQLSCGHRFHEPCLLEWLAKARRCPVCRLDLHQAHRRAVNMAADSGA
mmetsp:Transcript_106705/g.329663  ORF Transcript_106705/g.329663 Transcript_106705/m.329663 type:complete len:294 (-) Transcript_106705:197-1078(-)